MGDPELPRPILKPAGFLLDLDGTLYTDGHAVAGGPAALAELRRLGTPFRCVTNTTTRDRAGLVARLEGYGYAVAAREIMTPAVAAVAICRDRGLEPALALVPEAVLPDLSGLHLVSSGEAARVVLVGDLRERWNYGLLQQAFDAMMDGAELLALSKDRYFQNEGRLALDAGPFVAGLEYATGRTATVVGKPSPSFYAAAREELGKEPGSVVMVGDDLWSDVRGAQAAGMQGWLVRTGKFREESLRSSGITPERTIASVAELPGIVRGAKG
ncbi:MAG TPA: TIGR01458 family HAD-type hydrolase [Gemmatimonadales bacterium]|nr:TIGR01458 family HAD-type hydrolase [Gemmatimonadales bacterium]